MLCVDWQESSDGEGGWLVTGCSTGSVGVSWIDSKEAIAKKNIASRLERDCEVESAEEEDGGGMKGQESETGEKSTTREDNLACTKAACLYKSHFILRNHTGEVRMIHLL